MTPRISSNESPKRYLSRLALKFRQAIREHHNVDIMEEALVENETNVSYDGGQYGDVYE